MDAASAQARTWGWEAPHAFQPPSGRPSRRHRPRTERRADPGERAARRSGQRQSPSRSTRYAAAVAVRLGGVHGRAVAARLRPRRCPCSSRRWNRSGHRSARDASAQATGEETKSGCPPPHVHVWGFFVFPPLPSHQPRHGPMGSHYHAPRLPKYSARIQHARFVRPGARAQGCREAAPTCFGGIRYSRANDYVDGPNLRYRVLQHRVLRVARLGSALTMASSALAVD